jgi:hypothetical protein
VGGGAIRRRAKRPYGFRAGDHVWATVTKGQNRGTWRGHVTGVNNDGSNGIKTVCGKTMSAMSHNMKLIRRRDGYAYA